MIENKESALKNERQAKKPCGQRQHKECKPFRPAVQLEFEALGVIDYVLKTYPNPLIERLARATERELSL